MSNLDDRTKEQWKKEGEANRLSLFLDAYEKVTGECLEIERQSERPDFICQRPSGDVVGVELSRIIDSPDEAQWRAIVEKRESMDLDETMDRIQALLINKDNKRREGDWELPDSSILVLELIGTSLADIEPFLTEDSLPDLTETGFKEVWLADYSVLEAYGNVELFALRHPRLSGHQHLNRGKKPWG